MRYVLLFTCCHAVQYKVTFKRVNAFAKPGTAVRGDVDDATCPYRFDLYAGGRSRKAGERERSSIIVSTERAVDATWTLRLIGEKVAVEADGGAIDFRAFIDGTVHVRLRGACAGCPSSTATLKDGIERLLTSKLDVVQSVVAST